MSHEVATATSIDWHDCAAVAGSSSWVPTVRTSEVCLVFTSAAATESAARVARDLARALAVPLAVVLFKCTRWHRQASAAASPDDEVQAVVERLRAEGNAVTTRAYVCQSMRQGIPFAFSPRSLVVVGGRHSWLPTQTERLRHALERAHHFVIVVDDSSGARATQPDGSDPPGRVNGA